MPLFQLNSKCFYFNLIQNAFISIIFILLNFTSYAITNSNTVMEILPLISYNNYFQCVLSGVALGTLLVAGCQRVNVNGCALCRRDKFT